MLDAMAWRAARLVVDTGIHAQAVDTRAGRRADARRRPVATRTRRSRRTATSHGPGQALTYKVGQREIERLRGEIARRDGSRFDLRAFHDAVIGHGVAAARDAGPRTADLGRHAGLTLGRSAARDRADPNGRRRRSRTAATAASADGRRAIARVAGLGRRYSRPCPTSVRSVLPDWVWRSLQILLIVVVAWLALRIARAFVHGIFQALLEREATEGTSQDLSAVELRKRMDTLDGLGAGLLRFGVDRDRRSDDPGHAWASTSAPRSPVSASPASPSASARRASSRTTSTAP